eukprot:1133272-Pleurochrysis_carterae.AAC.1
MTRAHKPLEHTNHSSTQITTRETVLLHGDAKVAREAAEHDTSQVRAHRHACKHHPGRSPQLDQKYVIPPLPTRGRQGTASFSRHCLLGLWLASCQTPQLCTFDSKAPDREFLNIVQICAKSCAPMANSIRQRKLAERPATMGCVGIVGDDVAFASVNVPNQTALSCMHK